LLERRDVKNLCKLLFDNVKAAQNLTPTQCLLVRKIGFSEVKRLNISAYTRYGKTQCVAVGVAIYILLNKNKKIKFIGPEKEQAGLIRDYMTELILSCPELLSIAELTARGAERIKQQASRDRMTFSNGCEYRVVSAFGKGFAAMGHGGDLVIMDEAAMISREAYAKITRMLGDDPENAILIELFNPWDRDTKAFDHSISNRFERIEIGYKVGIKEGRTTKAFIDEMAEELGGKETLEFIVLYESRFPDEAPDSLHKLSDIEKAENRVFNLEDELIAIEEILLHPDKYKSSEVVKAKKDVMDYKRIISCDPADKGIDETVIMWGVNYKEKYELYGMFSEPKSEQMQIVGRTMNKAKKFIGPTVPGRINWDRIGIGAGALSRSKEIRDDWNMNNIVVNGCHYGESAIKKEEFINKKAENNFRLKDLLAHNNISLYHIKDDMKYRRLKNQLLAMKWEMMSGTSKKKVKDPEDKSPDFNDALTYMIWKGKELAWGFV